MYRPILDREWWIVGKGENNGIRPLDKTEVEGVCEILNISSKLIKEIQFQKALIKKLEKAYPMPKVKESKIGWWSRLTKTERGEL